MFAGCTREEDKEANLLAYNEKKNVRNSMLENCVTLGVLVVNMRKKTSRGRLKILIFRYFMDIHV